MPQRKCAQKRLRVDKTKALHNLQLKSDLKKEIKGLRSLIAQGKLDEAKEKIKVAFAKLDRAAAKGIIHKNTAARRKSTLSLKLSKKA
ncbi:MAG: 30S ribosomal protein S20 [Candidatus Omnitrophica bacterium]|jgi:small subunit ribosomal protein S20|nr:30S ribosomal protein S20 [Candidatus Omnitrophota bacterium]